nr:SEC-C metal-binding domain-containing protein [Planctomycetota bacterium]
DEFTGRLMAGRRWSDGLHQAVEAKEGITPRQENPTLATITLQNYFRLFDKLAGMTGTAMTEASEFEKIYKLEVVAIPTNRPLVRQDLEDLIYLGDKDKYDAIITDVLEMNRIGRPVLIGTTSIEKSERLSRFLTEKGIQHDVLNAKQHEREAQIVKDAGQLKSVVVATNMAGRGTDIKLGSGVRELGGLHIIGTERHESRRIDNQLRGRCGRQGDPGSSRFYLSFDDDLMRIFARDWVKTVMEKLGLKAGEAIEAPMVSRGIAKAQKKVEQRNFDIRKSLLEYDEVMDKQRKFIYAQRQDVLEGIGLEDKILGMWDEEIETIIDSVKGDRDIPPDTKTLVEWFRHKCGPDVELPNFEGVEAEDLGRLCTKFIEERFAVRKQEFQEDEFPHYCRFLLLDAIDTKWKDHLRAIEVLKAGIGLRGYAQVDPKNEFKKEGFEKFALLKRSISGQITDLFFRLVLRRDDMEVSDPFDEGPPMAAMPPVRDPQELQAMIEAMAAAGQLPPEIMAALEAGGRIVVDSAPGPDGQLRVSITNPNAAPAAGAAGAAEAGDGGVPTTASIEAEALVEPSAEVGKAAPIEQASDEAPLETVPRVGRNEACPCGSGKKYKMCHGRAD